MRKLISTIALTVALVTSDTAVATAHTHVHGHVAAHHFAPIRGPQARGYRGRLPTGHYERSPSCASTSPAVGAMDRQSR